MFRFLCFSLIIFYVCFRHVDFVSLNPYCYIYECCREPWILHNSTRLRETLDRKLCGQKPARDMIVKAFSFHWKDPNPSKPLVMSFHGSVGTGKTYVAQLLRESIFDENEETKFYHYISVPTLFPHQNDPIYEFEYRQKLHKIISDAVNRCPHAVIVIEEVHRLSVKLLEGIRPFLDSVQSVEGIDFRKATFILLTNTGYDGLVELAHNYYEDGLKDHDIPDLEVERVIRSIAYADKETAFYHNLLLARHLIDHYVPFFPMTIEHVKCCVDKEVKRLFRRTAEKELMDSIIHRLSFFPKHDPVFAQSGCKSVRPAIAREDIRFD